MLTGELDRKSSSSSSSGGANDHTCGSILVLLGKKVG
jgi:hypothetical protein